MKLYVWVIFLASLVNIAIAKLIAAENLANEAENYTATAVLKNFPRPMPLNDDEYEATVKEYFSDIPRINEPSIREAFNSIFSLPEYLTPNDFEYLYNAIGNVALPSDSIVKIISQLVTSQKRNSTLSRSGKHQPGLVKREGVPHICSEEFERRDTEEPEEYN